MSDVSAAMSFKASIQRELRLFVDDYAFREVTPDHLEASFEVWLRNGDVTIRLEGISYGSDLLVCVGETTADLGSACERWASVYELNPTAAPSSKKLRREAERLAAEVGGVQVALARLAASWIREHAPEILVGDASIVRRTLNRRDEERRHYEARRDDGIAVQDAVAAYRAGDWVRVVELLEPREPSLSSGLRKKLQIARTNMSQKAT